MRLYRRSKRYRHNDSVILLRGRHLLVIRHHRRLPLTYADCSRISAICLLAAASSRAAPQRHKLRLPDCGSGCLAPWDGIEPSDVPTTGGAPSFRLSVFPENSAMFFVFGRFMHMRTPFVSGGFLSLHRAHMHKPPKDEEHSGILGKD